MSPQQIQKSLREVAHLDCKSLAFCVGDPALVIDLTLESIASAINLGFSSIEYLTGTPLPEALIGYFADNKVIPTFQIFSCREESHDRVFGTKGGFSQLIDNINVFKKSNRPFNFYFLYTGEDKDPPDIIKKLKQLGPRLIYCDRMANNIEANTGFLFGKNNLQAPDVGIYINWLKKERCLNSVLTLNADGNYHFCPALFDKETGNVHSTTIQEIFARLDTDGIEAGCVNEAVRCESCEYNPACHICKVPNNQLDAEASICGYEPKEGVWLSGKLGR